MNGLWLKISSNRKPLRCASKCRGHSDVEMDVCRQVGITLKEIIGLLSNGATCD